MLGLLVPVRELYEPRYPRPPVLPGLFRRAFAALFRKPH